MIQANELRIGNYVAYADCGVWIPEIIGEPHKIEAEDYRNDGAINCYDPIPLTEEILLKAGFNNIEDQYFLTIDRGLCHSLHIEFEFVEKECFGTFWINETGRDKMLIEAECVHQLQNFHYSLTGYELKIEL